MREPSLRQAQARNTPEQIQHDFYTATAERYDSMHVAEGDEHYRALELISALVDGLGYRSVLDVGTGTGRGVKHFLDRHEGIEARGVEPVPAMIEQAERGGIPEGSIVRASGDQMPFEDGSFDAVCELGVLHHVADPNAVVAEMARVARRAVFLSDANRFANGGPVHRVAKYVLYRLGLWPLVYRLVTRGRGYHLNPGDGGVAYSYSVYDSLPLLNEWADRVFIVPTVPARTSWFHPLFGAHNVLLCALRDQGPPRDASRA
jgi:ubiquinone/menaquinone biosynthesis C-methylase UbiE